MDKIQSLTPLDESTTPFDFEGRKWELRTGWGDVVLHDLGTNAEFVMERGTGSVLNLSLMVFAVQNKTPGVKYSLTSNAEKDTYILQVTSPKEKHTYTFKMRVSGSLAVFTTGLKLLQDNCAHCKRLMPIVGTFRPVKWVEYSVRDIVADFDYSFLNLTKSPIILTSLLDNTGYTAIRNKTNRDCAVYIHRDVLPPPPMTRPEDILLEYCIFPREDVEEPLEEPPSKFPEPENTLFTYASVRQANEQGRELVVFEDQVIDVKRFLERHPGLAHPLKDTQGREIGRWIYGGYMWQDKEHEHSRDARELLAKYSVGTLDTSFRQQLFEGITEGKQLRDYPFTVSEQNGITDLHMHVKLKNPSIKYIPQVNDISLFGKYWAVTVPKLARTRNYACTFAAAEVLLTEYLRLVQNVDNKGDYKTPWESLMDFKTDPIPLVIKVKGKLSEYLVNNEEENAQVLLGGPYGPGLELSPGHKGTVVAFTGGTGSLQLLDLAAYLTRMNASAIGQKLNKNYKMFGDEDFRALSDPSFKFKLFSSYSSNAVPYHKMLKTADSWKTTYNTTNFECFIRVNDHHAAYWDEAFIKANVPADATKIYVAGGKAFTESIVRALLATGFPKHLITLL